MKTWWLPVSKNRQQATQALSKAEKNLKHVVSTACKPGVFRIALFKGFPNMPHIPPPTGHSAGTNETTKAPTPENAPCWHETARPREISVCNVLLKWVVTVLLMQTNDILHQVVPMEQKGRLRGRQIMEHVWHATGAWHEMSQGFKMTVDFRKAYDTVTFEYLAAVLNLMLLPSPYIRRILHVVASPRLYVV